jgi:predicted esterase
MQEMNAWYTPTGLSPFPSQRPELDDPEDEEGMMKSVKYTESLIDDLVAKGIPTNRIVLGGFSQGHAIALLTGLTSKKYAGKLAGLICLSGYLPVPARIAPLRAEAGLPESAGGEVPLFVVRGKTDVMVPKRYLRLQVEKMMELGIPGEVVEVHEYEGLGHSVSAPLLMDLLVWLEKIIPPVE